MTYPVSDSDKLLLLADWLDKKDDERSYAGVRDVQADLRRIADFLDDLGRPETASPTDKTQPRDQLAADRDAWKQVALELAEKNVRLKRDAAVLLRKVADYENRITWDTTCGNCARLLDASVADHSRAEQAEATVARVRLLATRSFMHVPCPGLGCGFTLADHITTELDRGGAAPLQRVEVQPGVVLLPKDTTPEQVAVVRETFAGDGVTVRREGDEEET